MNRKALIEKLGKKVQSAHDRKVASDAAECATFRAIRGMDKAKDAMKAALRPLGDLAWYGGRIQADKKIARRGDAAWAAVLAAETAVRLLHQETVRHFAKAALAHDRLRVERLYTKLGL